MSFLKKIEKNGDYYVQGGGAMQFIQKSLTAEKLRDAVATLLSDPEKLKKMSVAMKKLSYPDAAEQIVSCCLKRMKV